jgi:hypothetical protein
MPDQRVQHVTRPSHAVSLYGKTGPQQALGHYTERPLTTRLSWPSGQPIQPETISEHLQSAISRIPTLSAKQRAAVVAIMTEKCRDLHFAKLIAAQLHPMHDHSGGTLPPV